MLRCQALQLSAGRTYGSTGRNLLYHSAPKKRGSCRSLYNHRMRLRLVAAPLFLILMFAPACTMYKEHPAQSFSDATGGEGMERMFWKQVKDGNWTEIERVLASNYVGVTAAGSIDRDTTLQQYRQWKLTDFSIGDLRTELNTSTFVVTYTITLNGSTANQPLPSTPQHMMTVWQQQKKGWVVIAHSVSQS